MLDWDLLFSWLELADLFWVHNLSCSLFLGFRFSLSSHASASWPVLSSSSQAPSPWRLSPKILYTAAPGLNPLLKILGKSRLTTLQEASTRLSKAAMQKKKTTPEDSDKLKKNEAHMCHPELLWRAVRPRECQIELGKVKQSRIHPDFWSVSHNYRGKWCVLPLLHTAHTH